MDKMFATKEKVKKIKQGDRFVKIVSSPTFFLTVMLGLPICTWTIFWLYTRLSSILLAFQLPAGGWSLNNFKIFFAGLANPNNALNIAVRNTFIYFGTSLLVILPGSLAITYFLYKKVPGHGIYRAIFYFPAIVPQVVYISIFKEIIAPWGALNSILNLFGASIPAAGLLGSPDTATWTIVSYVVWTGFCGDILLFGGAMSRIPAEVIESAKLDGCGMFTELVCMVLPLMFPTIATVIVFTCTGIFSSSGPVLLMTGGSCETTTIAYWIFNNVMGDGLGGGGQYNLVSAVGLFFTVIGVPLILLVRWLLEKVPPVEY